MTSLIDSARSSAGLSADGLSARTPILQAGHPPPVSGSNMVSIDAETLAKLIAAAAGGSGKQDAITLEDGSKYIGQLADGKPHGRGTLMYPRGHSLSFFTYEGEFENGLPHGQGILIKTTKAKFEGFMSKGVPEEGTVTAAGGDQMLIGTIKVDNTGFFNLINGTSKSLTKDGWMETNYKDGKPVSDCCNIQ